MATHVRRKHADERPPSKIKGGGKKKKGEQGVGKKKKGGQGGGGGGKFQETVEVSGIASQLLLPTVPVPQDQLDGYRTTAAPPPMEHLLKTAAHLLHLVPPVCQTIEASTGDSDDRLVRCTDHGDSQEQKNKISLEEDPYHKLTEFDKAQTKSFQPDVPDQPPSR